MSVAVDVRAEADRLRAERRPFVLATVVRAERPTSARPGDSAVVLADGTIIGFVGGECAQASVQAQAAVALATGEPVLLRITPDAPAGSGAGGPDVAAEAAPPADSGAVTVRNPCLSGGALEIFLGPQLPPPPVVVHGDAPIARAVRELAQWLGYEALAWSDAAVGGAAAVVVASHGADEAEVLRSALRAGVPYVGLVASPRRGAAVLAALELADEERARVDTPAGIDIGADSPHEVALSIMAEIVARRPRPAPPPAGGVEDGAGAGSVTGATASDPVCGMTVAAVEASRHVDHQGTRYWFCGAGCEQAFRADPAAFVEP